MSVEVVTQPLSNPVTTNGSAAVANAFMRIYGIDIRRALVYLQFYLSDKAYIET